MKMPNRVLKVLAITALALMVLSTFTPLSVSATTVQSTDFQSQSFSKVVDWFDYVRQYAAANGFTPPNASDHAYIYANYINVGGYQLFYVGLVNVTDNGKFVTVPLQTFFQHFKTPGGKDAITASSFLSLVAFNESSTSDAVPNSPDPSDTVYASFSLGVDLSSYLQNHAPSYVAGSQVIPLTQVGTNHWTWGLKYTNLSAIWWKITPDPLLPYYDPVPHGVARYTELTFNYDLTLDPSTKTAHLTETFTIGKVTDLWIIRLFPTFIRHYNATGSYYVNGTQTPNSQTVYQLLQSGGYKLSVVLANKTILASHTTTDKDSSGNSVDDTQSGDLSHSNVTTTADDGERIFQADFSAKSTYQLYDPSDANPVTYNVTTRTVRRDGYVKNPLFALQNRFMGFLPLFVAHVDPGLIQQAKAGLASFTVTDYLYIIAYPHWGGTRIVNDPDYTAFYQPASNAGLLIIVFIAVAVAAVVGGVFAFLMRRRKTANMGITAAPGQTPPTQGPAGPTIPGR